MVGFLGLFSVDEVCVDSQKKSTKNKHALWQFGVYSVAYSIRTSGYDDSLSAVFSRLVRRLHNDAEFISKIIYC